MFLQQLNTEGVLSSFSELFRIRASHLQIFNDWHDRIGMSLDRTVVLLTGEPSTDLKLLQRGKLIIATPER